MLGAGCKGREDRIQQYPAGQQPADGLADHDERGALNLLTDDVVLDGA